ncbi:BgTH12-00474 [Blumeria graminis f. sp. triticale]|uniref:BgTH12-00471 n=1 Tax=Blumeria graminis f. sp. triticale TaxID=1689686 RepID=A0A9W4D6Z2_BLUGR|nr:BgTH12-00471 [Blumeria graminis f. sp. triticale]CAD6504975.1 BgTH12-00474 [Blumeria graminis f. sp. triticale]
MRFFFFILALMISGFIAVPTGSYVVRRTNKKTTGTKFLEKLDGYRFQGKVDALSEKMRETIENVLEKISTFTTDKFGKKAESVPKLSEPRILTPAVNETSHSNHTKRFLRQNPSGYQLDGKKTFPYYNKKSKDYLDHHFREYQKSSA